MGALADLLVRPHPAANPANPANQGDGTAADSQHSRHSQGGASATRKRLHALAVSGGQSPEIAGDLPDADVAECEALDDNTLRAYLRAVERGAHMDAGTLPPGYTQRVECSGCGPVWLWAGSPQRVIACPWCFRRKADKPFPRPPAHEGGWHD